MTKTANGASVLASVAFLKIPEFPRRPVQEQARLRAQLEAVVAVTAAELAPDSRIVLDASDGIAVVVLRDPQGALRLAQRALGAATAGLPVCAGLNHGAVKLAGGQGEAGMIGDGIAVAASVAEFAPSSRLLASRAFRDALADAAPGAEAGFVSAGVFTDAGLRTHELFTPEPRALVRLRRRRMALGTVAAIVLVGAGVGIRLSSDRDRGFIDDTLASMRHSASEGRAFFRNLAEKVNLRK